MAKLGGYNTRGDGKYNKEYYQKNREKLIKNQLEYHYKNKDKITKQRLKYKELGLTRIWAKRFNEKNKEKIKNFYFKYRRDLNDEIFNILGNKCIICGHNNKRHLQKDRIKGGKHPSRLVWILAHINEFQLLCANHHNEKTAYKVIFYEGKEFRF